LKQITGIGFIFNNANLRGANFKGSNIEDVQFIEADLKEVNLETDVVLSYFGRFGYFETFILKVFKILKKRFFKHPLNS